MRLPYFRNRRYLTGIDWIIGALHQSAFKTTGVGSFSQAVLDVAGRVEESPLRTALDQISARLPIIHGRVARDAFNLCPFWKIPKPGQHDPLPLRIVDLPAGADDEAAAHLTDHVNSAFASESQHLRLMLVRIPPLPGGERAGVRGETSHDNRSESAERSASVESSSAMFEQTASFDDPRCPLTQPSPLRGEGFKSRLGLVFDHRLLDATGAEAFLRLIDETAHGRLEQYASQMQQTEPAHLDHWIHRFSSGRRLNKLLYKLDEQDVCALAPPPKETTKRVRFVLESLTVEETAAVSTRAAEEIGLPIILPSAAARATLAMRHVFPETPLPGEQYLLSTSANARPPGEPWEKFFFNNFSFLMFSLPKSAPADVAEAAKAFRDQFFDQVKNRIPEAMIDAAVLWRILPPSLVAKLTRFLFKGRMCSLYFACVKETGYPGNTFFDLPATNLIHTPLAFSPPGLNLCMTFFGGRFNLVLSYLEGVMTDAEGREMMRWFKQSLTENEPRSHKEHEAGI